MIVAAEIVAPVFGFVVGQDRDRAFHQYFAVHLAAEAVGAAGGRADGQYDAVFGQTRDGSETPVLTRAHQEPRAYGKRREFYLNFVSFHILYLPRIYADGADKKKTK